LHIQFLGAAQQITGSCYFLDTGAEKILVDCGMYQERKYLARNWDPFPVPLAEIDYLLLTHVHLDHSGLIPKAVRKGFSGKIILIDASSDLFSLMLEDSARIQEEDAAYKKKRHKKEKRKGPYPVVPLYTVEDVERSYEFLESVPYGKELTLSDDLRVCFYDAGHILGAAMIEIQVKKNGSWRRILFSGDIGQRNKPLVHDPAVFDRADFVIMESLYGNRLHQDPMNVEDMLCNIINETAKAGGNVIIPTFAVERAQEILFYLGRLVRKKRIPYMMIFLDSPMAVDATAIFQMHKSYLDDDVQMLLKQGKEPFQFTGLRFVRSVHESKEINTIKGSHIVLAGSGMCTGGRIKHHLVQNISRENSTILFVGYQAPGTLGRQITDGKEHVRIHGQTHPVRARIEQIHGFSGHADRDGLLEWIFSLQHPPRKVFLTHGELESAQSLAGRIKKAKGWPVAIPQYLQKFDLM